MRRCLELALLGIETVSPNPMVGCVIVHDDKIIGEGYHLKFGEAHAEVNAVNDVIERNGSAAPELLADATAFVSLEPCAHFGKTPPCADLLVKHGIKKVVIGNRDPFSEVDGKGIMKLREAGINVSTGILEKECTYTNRRFFTRIRKQRPYIILKWAQTADGFFAPSNNVQRWISGPEAKQLSHKWRSEEDAILVGKTTAVVDNPSLTTRLVSGKNPIRIVVDKSLTIPTEHQIYNDEAKTVIFNEVKTDVVNNIHFIQMEDMQFYLPQKIAFQLYLMDIQSVIIEGGEQILTQFIESNLWDEARVFKSKNVWAEGINAPKIIGDVIEQINVGEDQLSILTPKNE